MLNATRKAIMNEVFEWSCVSKPVADDEFTVADFALQIGRKNHSTKDLLDRMVVMGKLSKREARSSNGHVVTAYRIV